MTTALLVCEGRCNGGDVQRFDEAVRRARATDRMTVTMAEGWLALARRLVHTRHEALTEYDYRCAGCGTFRRYGMRPVVREAPKPDQARVTGVALDAGH